MKKPKSRKDKIKLLTELQAGKISVNELKPLVYQAWFQDRNDRDYFKCHETGIRCTREKIESYNPKGFNTMNILVEYTKGYSIL